jgi:hypothetical protein
MNTRESAENERERSAALDVVPAACVLRHGCLRLSRLRFKHGWKRAAAVPTYTNPHPRKGPKRAVTGRALLGRGGRPLCRWRWAAGCSGSWNAQRKRGVGDWRPCCPFSARGRCPHGPCSKKFRLQHLAVQGDDAHTDNPFAMATNSIKLLTGNSYPQLAQLVADRYVDAILEHFRALLLAQVPTPA